jgi:hypothetical protein
MPPKPLKIRTFMYMEKIESFDDMLHVGDRVRFRGDAGGPIYVIESIAFNGGYDSASVRLVGGRTAHPSNLVPAHKA